MHGPSIGLRQDDDAQRVPLRLVSSSSPALYLKSTGGEGSKRMQGAEA